MKYRAVCFGVSLLSMLVFSTTILASGPPVAKLTQVVGFVEYSRNGDTWRLVRGTKYLFPGYQIKTGKDGSAKLIYHQSGLSQHLGVSSEVKVNNTGIELISGSLSEPRKETASIFNSLVDKFTKSQVYATIRRGASSEANPSCDSKVKTIKYLALSATFPDLVWRNACPELSYRLLIDGAIHEVAADESEMIRFTVSGIPDGEHSYRVEVMDENGPVYVPRKDSKFLWIPGDEEQDIKADLARLDGDVFLESDYLESKMLFVAAMDAYRQYFDENPSDHDMRPVLINSYNDLKLTDLKQDEVRVYNQFLADLESR